MKRAIILWLPLFSSALRGMPSKPPLENLQPDFSTTVRVLLERQPKTVKISSLSGALYLRTADHRPWIRLDGDAEVTLAANPHVTGFQVNGVTLPTSTLVFQGPVPDSSLRYQASLYRGRIQLNLESKTITVANHLPLESYLRGMVGSEMSASWENEALRAQSVASRTYALYRLKNPRHRFYDLEKGILDQVYSGVEAESVRVKNAVRETAGQFLSRAGHPIKAYYHSRCGGSTETSDSVWKQRFGPGQKIVDCPYCRRNPYHWKASFDLSDLSRALKLPVFQILSIQKTPSGRIAELTVGEPGKEKKITSDEFRSLLGYTRLKSALFEWRIERQDVRFEGIGAGHGVGMCQWGARYLAQQGLNYRQILKYYYPEASLATRSSPLKKLSKSAESG